MSTPTPAELHDAALDAATHAARQVTGWMNNEMPREDADIALALAAVTALTAISGSLAALAAAGAPVR